MWFPATRSSKMAIEHQEALEAQQRAGRARPAASVSDVDEHATPELPSDSMTIPHPDGLNLGEYAQHLFEVAKIKGIVDGREGGWSGMMLALIRSNIKECAEKAELWMPPEDWIPRPRGVLCRSPLHTTTHFEPRATTHVTPHAILWVPRQIRPASRVSSSIQRRGSRSTRTR